MLFCLFVGGNFTLDWWYMFSVGVVRGHMSLEGVVPSVSCLVIWPVIKCVCRCTAKRVALELRSEHSASGSAGHGSARPDRRRRRDVSHTHTRARFSEEYMSYIP